MKAAEAFVAALENEGVKYIFGIPGEENIDLLEALRGSSIQLVLTRHEQAAGFMAATVGRLTGQAGVALSTLGPGATNFMTAVAYAQLGAMPALFITGQKPIRKSKQGQFQIIDTVSMFRPLSKYTHQIASAVNVPIRVREAFRQANAERPGAVHLELPEDIAAETLELEHTQLLPVSNPRRPVAEEKALAQAVALIESAQRPVIVVGAGSNRTQVSKMLTRLIDVTKIPFIPTQMGKGVVDERHPSYVGTAALSAHDYVHCALNEADLIINIGHDVIEKPPFMMRPHDTRQVVHINFASAAVDEVYFPQLEVVGDIAHTLWQLSERVTPQPAWDFSAYDTARTKTATHTSIDTTTTTFPLKPQYIVHTVREQLADDAILSLDNGMYKLWFARYYPTYQPNTLLLDNALATMGAGFPAAIAAKLIHPDKTVVGVVGDGGFMMNSQELETALRLKLHLILIIINDNAFGMIKWKQTDHGFPNFGMDTVNPDFVKYAESYGAKGYRVEQATDLAKYLQTAIVVGSGVHVIEVPVDYSENVKVFTNEIKAITNPT